VTRPSADHANGAPIRAVIADDTLAVRRLLMKVLSDSPLFEVVGEASDGRQAVELAAARRPDLVLIDLAMPIMGGSMPSLRSPGGRLSRRSSCCQGSMLKRWAGGRWSGEPTRSSPRAAAATAPQQHHRRLSECRDHAR